MSLGFQLEIDCSSPAFGGSQAAACDEIARILEKLTLELRTMRSAPSKLRDYDGNTVGTCCFKEV